MLTLFTRAPVYAQELDDASRAVSVLDLVGRWGTVADHATDAVVLPEALDVVRALRALQQARQQMALVVSEYGGLEGIVTVEDLVEEVVGEIHDEYDRDIRAVERREDGSFRVVGRFPLHDLGDLGIDLPDGDYVTVAGLVLTRLGHLPQGGEQITVGDWTLVVDEVTGREVRRATMRPSRHRGGGSTSSGGFDTFA